MGFLDSRSRLKIIFSKDIALSIIFLIVGILIVLFGFSFSEIMNLTFLNYFFYINLISGNGSPGSLINNIWIWLPGWIIIFLGLASIFYGIKRTIDNIFKIMILDKS